MLNGPGPRYVLEVARSSLRERGFMMRSRWWAPAGLAAVALTAAACGSSAPSGSPAGSSSSASAVASGPGSASSVLKTATVGGVTVLTNAKGFTLYWFVPDTSTTSHCTGSCARYWPPVKGPATAGSGVTGTLGTITRPDGSTQVTYNGHPLYSYVGDTAPGQNRGNGLNLSGGVWHEVTVSGAAAPSASPSGSSGGGGGGYGY
jgi:predicted lipoprotein with Yx(FWY)xxD motif